MRSVYEQIGKQASLALQGYLLLVAMLVEIDPETCVFLGPGPGEQFAGSLGDFQVRASASKVTA